MTGGAVTGIDPDTLREMVEELGDWIAWVAWRKEINDPVWAEPSRGKEEEEWTPTSR